MLKTNQSTPLPQTVAILKSGCELEKPFGRLSHTCQQINKDLEKKKIFFSLQGASWRVGELFEQLAGGGALFLSPFPASRILGLCKPPGGWGELQGP